MRADRELFNGLVSILTRATIALGISLCLSLGFGQANQVNVSKIGIAATNAKNVVTYKLTVWNRLTALSGVTVSDTPPAALINVAWTCRGFGGASCASSSTNVSSTGNLSLVTGNLPQNNVATAPTSGGYLEITIAGTAPENATYPYTINSNPATVTRGATVTTSGTPAPSTTIAAIPNACVSAGGTLETNQFTNGSFGTLTGTPSIDPPTLGGPLPNGTTTYSYLAASPNDGEYNITNSIRYRTDGAWHYPNGHTTGLATDLMMGVNASYQPGVFFEQTLSVTPNTIYSTSAWVTNLIANNASILPNLEFELDRVGFDDDYNPATLDGNEGQTIAVTGDIVNETFVTWKNYTAFVNSGGASQIIVRIRNNAPGGGGNDLALDDLSFNACTNIPIGYITGFAYPDISPQNDARDTGEGGLDGVTVYLYDSTNTTLITSTKTAFDGSYTFTVPAAAAGTSYNVRVLSTDPALPSGATLGTPGTLAVTVLSGQTVSNRNFGYDFAARIFGTVFEDITYGGGPGRPLAAAFNSVPRSNVRVELYTSAGAFVSAAFTDAQGRYSFSPTVSTFPATYFVRVVNNFVTSSRGGACGQAANVTTAPSGCTQLSVQTFRTQDGANVTNEVGGKNPAVIDAALNTTGTLTVNATANTLSTGGEAKSVSRVVLANTSSRALGVDFGFNFDTIVNINGAGQGSLSQFITNSNALSNIGLKQDDTSNTVSNAITKPLGKEVSIFMIPAALASGGVFTIAPSTSAPVFPTITDSNTTLDGATQTAFTGDTNLAITDTAGATATTGPEIVLSGVNSANGAVLDTTGPNTTLANVGITSGKTSNGHGVLVRANNFILRDSTVFANAGTGVQVSSSGVISNGFILNSVIRNNGTAAATLDGISLNNANTWTIINNNINTNNAFGVELAGGSSAITINNNTIFSNGASASEKAGIGVTQATTTTIDTNTIRGNGGDGVVVTSNSNTVVITKNAIFNNGGATVGELGIDLGAGTAVLGDGVTLNENGDGDAGGNDLLNYPILASSTLSGTNFIITGFARPGSVIEFFVSPSADPSNFGEGQVYIATFTEGSAADTDTGTGTYGSAAVNGVSQGTDTTNRFTFTIPTSSFPSYNSSSVLTATATLGGKTSEFSGRLLFAAALPLADAAITKTTTPASVNVGTAISYTLRVWNNGPTNATGVAVTDTLPAGLTGVTWTCVATGVADCDTAAAGTSSSGSGNIALSNVSLNTDTGSTTTADTVFLTITINAVVASTLPATNPLPNTATVRLPTSLADSDAANNSATASTLIYQLSPSAGVVIINEVLYRQTGSSAVTNDEFIELYNASASPVDLTTLKLLDGYLFDNDGIGSITSSANPFTFLCTGGQVCSGSTTLAPGQYAVIWVGTQDFTRTASDATFQAWLGQAPKLADAGDDVWLHDAQNRVVDYVAYGTGGLNTPPPAALGLWGGSNAPATATNGQSLSLTPNGANANDGRCWEITTATGADTAVSRGCPVAALPTRDTDTNLIGGTVPRLTSMGVGNNGVPRVGLAKALERIVHSNQAGDNDYILVYAFTVENFGDVALSSLEIFDNVSSLFAGLNPREFNGWVGSNAVTPGPTLTVNLSWDGTSSSNLLQSGQTLAPSSSKVVYVSFKVTVDPNATASNNRLRDNTALVNATAPGAVIVSDTSTNGLDPDGSNNDYNPNENSSTPVYFVKLLKEVRNCGNILTSCSGSYVLTTTGKPGDYLEYRIRYYNISSQVIATLSVNDSLVAGIPFQEDTYSANTEFSLTCPNSSIDLDRSSPAVTTTPPTGAITAFAINIMSSSACNLTTLSPGQGGQVLFKVKIP
jgi:uncharacterized repeat protein (TIGR01451 family)